jgi:calcineurin-like phosphoesterase family protein
MARVWLYADPHFYHEGICKFTNYDGTKVRPWDDAEEMSEWMINAYNELVRPNDRVYILGDVAMNRKALDRSLPRLMGRKVLIKGNHDTDKLSYYSKYFEDIRAVDGKKGYVMTHVPLHPDCLDRWGVNIHGHLHGNSIKDPRYKCVSVEHTGFKPVLLEEVLDAVRP